MNWFITLSVYNSGREIFFAGYNYLTLGFIKEMALVFMLNLLKDIFMAYFIVVTIIIESKFWKL